MRRRKLLVALAGLAVVVAVGAVALRPRPERITRENYDRLQPGMSVEEVEAILGPPGDYRTRDSDFEADLPKRDYKDGGRGIIWAANGFAIVVYFDNTQKVLDMVPHSFTSEDRGLLDSLLWRAKRQWHRWFPE